MSVIYCHACDTHVDTDYNVEHFDVDDVEITVKKFPDSFEVQIISGDAIFRKHWASDETKIGEIVADFLGEIKFDCEKDDEEI